jgi:hypothetical protein
MRIFTTIYLLAITLYATASVVDVAPWTPLFQGIAYTHVTCTVPMVQVHVLRVDLTAPGIRFATTPGNGDAPLETNSQCTSAFLKTTGCQVAINTAAFSHVVDQDGVSEDILGVAIADGALISPPQAGYAAVLFSAVNQVRIVDQPCDIAGVRQAVSGFRRILIDGANVCDPTEVWHPRTAIGLGQDGKTLLLLVIDGRQSGYSDGAPCYAVAAWLRAFGAYQAINLDGGGSTSMVMTDGHGGVTILNRPIHKGIPGLERPVGANLGVYALPVQR